MEQSGTTLTWRLGKTDEAIAAFKKQIEINAYDGFAYNDLGLAYQRQKSYDDAISSSRSRSRSIPWTSMRTPTWAACT